MTHWNNFLDSLVILLEKMAVGIENCNIYKPSNQEGYKELLYPVITEIIIEKKT